MPAFGWAPVIKVVCDLFFILDLFITLERSEKAISSDELRSREVEQVEEVVLSNDETNRPGKNYWKGIWKGLSESLDFNEPARTPKSNEPAIYRSQRYTPTNVTLKKRQKPSAFYDRYQPSAEPR